MVAGPVEGCMMFTVGGYVVLNVVFLPSFLVDSWRCIICGEHASSVGKTVESQWYGMVWCDVPWVRFY